VDLSRAIADAKSGDTIQIPAGRYAVNLELTRPITLLAMGQVVLDGLHSGSVLRVSTSGLVRLSGLMLVGGTAIEGGGAICHLGGELELSDCTLRFNKAPQYGGGGLYVGDGSVKVTRCRFEANTGRQGGAILVDGAGRLQVEHSTIIQNAAIEGGGLKVKEGAEVSLVGCTIADNKVVSDAASKVTGVGGALHVGGTTTRAPSVRVSCSIVSERAEGPSAIFNDPRHPGRVSFSRCVLPPWCASLGGEQNVFAHPAYLMSGAEPYLLDAKSPAVGAAKASDFAAGDKDVLGHPRDRKGVADLGAFTFAPKSSGALPY